jgi:hypothetical protein
MAFLNKLLYVLQDKIIFPCKKNVLKSGLQNMPFKQKCLVGQQKRLYWEGETLWTADATNDLIKTQKVEGVKPN